MWKVGTAAAMVLAGVLLAACGNDADDATPGAMPADDEHEEMFDDPGMMHVHGLGMNPADGLLYVATHTGLFRLREGGEPERVSERLHDFMGFTVVGADHFYTSGHPDLRDYREGELPPHLGLMESTDGGRTWTPVTLLGDADFHALRYEHGMVYGFDSTGRRFMTWDGEGDWEERSTLLLYDFVVHPEEPDVVIATTQAGPAKSTDGGRTWSPIEGAPLLVWLEWAPAGGLWAIGQAGGVFLSEDDGQSWAQQGQAERDAESFLVEDGVLYVALLDGGIARSEDGGATWTWLYEP